MKNCCKAKSWRRGHQYDVLPIKCGPKKRKSFVNISGLAGGIRFEREVVQRGGNSGISTQRYDNLREGSPDNPEGDKYFQHISKTNPIKLIEVSFFILHWKVSKSDRNPAGIAVAEQPHALRDNAILNSSIPTWLHCGCGAASRRLPSIIPHRLIPTPASLRWHDARPAPSASLQARAMHPASSCRSTIHNPTPSRYSLSVYTDIAHIAIPPRGNCLLIQGIYFSSYGMIC